MGSNADFMTARGLADRNDSLNNFSNIGKELALLESQLLCEFDATPEPKF
jgi:hypothetical protein